MIAPLLPLTCWDSPTGTPPTLGLPDAGTISRISSISFEWRPSFVCSLRFDLAVRRLSRTVFFHRQNATSGQNPCVFTCILKDRPFYHWFFMVFAKYGLLGSIQGFPQDSQVRQRSSERPLWPSGPKVIPPWAQSCRGEFFGRVWTKTNDILPCINQLIGIKNRHQNGGLRGAYMTACHLF